MSFPAGETVTLIRRGPVSGRDGFGNDVYGPDVEIDVSGCAVAPTAGSEDVQARDQVAGHLTVWLPAGTEVRATDRARVRGEVYEVTGPSQSWRSPFTGRPSPVQAGLTRVSG